jgi:hypothetical protein
MHKQINKQTNKQNVKGKMLVATKLQDYEVLSRLGSHYITARQ